MRLTDQDDKGNWCLEGLQWERLRAGETITEEMSQIIHEALCKLREYENTEMTPEEVKSLTNFEETQTYRLLVKLNEEQEKHKWVPITEALPDPDKQVLLSFSNASFVMIGRYTVDDDDGGTFRVGDMDETFVEHDVFVNAWMKLPEPYREDE